MRGGDEGVSDFVGTLLLVAVVVVLGSALALVVTASLDRAAPPAASVSLGSLQPGATEARLVLRHGGPVALADLDVTLQRNASAPVAVPRATWATVDSIAWRAGETLALPLSPPAGQDETVRVTLVTRDPDAVLAAVQARTPFLHPTASPLGTPTLVADVTPSSIVADASSAALVAVRVSHPAGALGVASVTLDASNLTNASGSAGALLALSDAGIGGDETGGDGVWSGLLRASINTTPGRYNLTVVATDLSGRAVAAATANVTITSSLAGVVANATTALTNLTSTISNATNFTGTFYGSCDGCVVQAGVIVIEGSRIPMPTSKNVTSLKLVNWTWDRAHPTRLQSDAMVARIIAGTYAWSAYIRFAYPTTGPNANTALVTHLEVWNANATTVYAPPANGRVPLASLQLDLLDPTQSGFACQSGCSTRMTYQNADIRGAPMFLVAWLRDETNNFQTDEIGIYSTDVMAR